MGLEAEALGDQAGVAGGEIHGVELALAVQGLQRTDPAEGGVVEMDQHGRDLEPGDGLEFAGGHAEAAVAEQAHQPRAGLREKCADHRRNGIAQAAVGARDDEARALSGQLEETRDEGRRGSGIGDDDGGWRQVAVQRRHDALRPDRRCVRIQRRLRLLPEPAAQAVQLVHPRGGCPGRAGVLEQDHQVVQHQAGVAGDAERIREVVAQQFGVEVDLEDLAVGAVGGQRPVDGGHRAHLTAHVEQDVAVLDRAVGVGVEAVVADDPQRQRVLVRHDALAGNGGDHRRAEPLRQRDDLGAGLGVVGAAAGDNDGTARAAELPGQLLEHLATAAGAEGRVFAAVRLGVDRVRLARVLALERLLGQGQVHRAGSAGGGDAEGAAEGFRNLAHVLEHARPLGDGLEELLAVELGDGLLALAAERDVGGHQDDRDGGGVGLGHPRDGIERACAAGAFADPGLVGQARVGVGHERSGAFVAGHHVADAFPGVVERLVEGNAGVPGDTEDEVHLVLPQHVHDDVGADHGNPPEGIDATSSTDAIDSTGSATLLPPPQPCQIPVRQAV